MLLGGWNTQKTLLEYYIERSFVVPPQLVGLFSWASVAPPPLALLPQLPSSPVPELDAT